MKQSDSGAAGLAAFAMVFSLCAELLNRGLISRESLAEMSDYALLVLEKNAGGLGADAAEARALLEDWIDGLRSGLPSRR